MTVLVAVETAVLVVLTVLVAGLLRAYATVLRRLHELDEGGPPPFRTAAGVPAPREAAAHPAGRIEGRSEWAAAQDIHGVGLDGEVIAARVAAVEHSTVLLFLSSGCTGCAAFWDELATPARLPLPAGARLLVVAKDAGEESTSALRALCPSGTDLVLSGTAWSDYEVPGSPYVVVVDGRTGRVTGAGSAASLTQLAGLMAQATGDLRDARRHGVVKPAGDRARELDVDRELLSAGIAPGDPQLYAPNGHASDAPPEL